MTNSDVSTLLDGLTKILQARGADEDVILYILQLAQDACDAADDQAEAAAAIIAGLSAVADQVSEYGDKLIAYLAAWGGEGSYDLSALDNLSTQLAEMGGDATETLENTADLLDSIGGATGLIKIGGAVLIGSLLLNRRR